MAMIVPDDGFLQNEIEQLAIKAGDRILKAAATVRTKTSRRDLVTSTDLEIQKMLMKRLDIFGSPCSFFCEEDLSVPGIRQITDPEQISKGVCFIIDPIDGTANFVHGLAHSCTSIAMTVGGETRIGVIYDPYHKELFSACKGRGAWLNGHRLPELAAGSTDSEAAGSTSTESHAARLSDMITVFGTAPYDESTNERTFRMAQMLYEMSGDVRRTGSAALDLCWTAAGRFGLYAELSLSSWDFAAGKLIAEETGCVVTDIDGQPLDWAGKHSILCGRPAFTKAFLEKQAEME